MELKLLSLNPTRGQIHLFSYKERAKEIVTTLSFSKHQSENDLVLPQLIILE